MGRIGDPKFSSWANLYKLETTRHEIEWPRNSHVMPDSNARRFASVMAFFLDRARREGRVEHFLDSCYTYLITRWPFRSAPPDLFHFWQHERKDLWRVELLRQYHKRHLFDPPGEWELLLALPFNDFEDIADEILKESDDLADEASRKVLTLKPDSLIWIERLEINCNTTYEFIDSLFSIVVYF
ncbi:hypothetical protein MD484_g9017, partial [Candolleomyces efflorescens]